MDLELAGRKALVTGSTAGIGFAVARLLAAEGVDVVITGRTPAGVEAALARLHSQLPSARVEGIAADCASAEGAALVLARVPRVDILINNLGIYERRRFFDIPDENWQRLFDVNVMSGVRFARHYAPAMRERGWGRVIFVSSESGLSIPKDMIHYGMTKAAQLAVSRGLAIELAGTGVTVNSVLPGPTRTENTDRMRAQRAQAAGISVAELEADYFVSVRPGSLIRRFATPDEVANLTVYLCGNVASATTGSALRVDGGTVNQIN